MIRESCVKTLPVQLLGKGKSFDSQAGNAVARENELFEQLYHVKQLLCCSGLLWLYHNNGKSRALGLQQEKAAVPVCMAVPAPPVMEWLLSADKQLLHLQLMHHHQWWGGVCRRVQGPALLTILHHLSAPAHYIQPTCEASWGVHMVSSAIDSQPVKFSPEPAADMPTNSNTLYLSFITHNYWACTATR